MWTMQRLNVVPGRIRASDSAENDGGLRGSRAEKCFGAEYG